MTRAGTAGGLLVQRGELAGLAINRKGVHRATGLALRAIHFADGVEKMFLGRHGEEAGILGFGGEFGLESFPVVESKRET